MNVFVTEHANHLFVFLHQSADGIAIELPDHPYDNNITSKIRERMITAEKVEAQIMYPETWNCLGCWIELSKHELYDWQFKANHTPHTTRAAIYFGTHRKAI